MTPGRSLSLLLGCAAVAAGGGCGGGSGPAPTPTTPPSTAATTTGPAEPGPRLDLHGLGPVRVGMTVDQAALALGAPLRPVTPPTPDCTLYAPPSGLDGVAFLVARGTVASVVVSAGTTATTEGLALGQTEADAQRRYGGRLRSAPHDFLLGGHYLTLVPADPADAGFRLVAETDGTRVTVLRAGRLPEVELTEPCS